MHAAKRTFSPLVSPSLTITTKYSTLKQVAQITMIQNLEREQRVNLTVSLVLHWHLFRA